MDTRVEDAVNKKRNGYNCAQAVLCTYCDLAGIDEESAKQMTQAFAGGMCTMEASCGAMTGAAIALGLINKQPGKTMMDIRDMMTAFKAQNKSVICKELKGIETGTVLRACDDCVRDAAMLLEAHIAR